MNRTRRRGRLGTELGLTYVRVTFVAVSGLLATGLALIAWTTMRSHEQRHEEVARRLAPIAAELLAEGAPAAVLASFVDRPIRPSADGVPLLSLMSLPPAGRTAIVDARGAPWYEADAADAPVSTDAGAPRQAPRSASEALASGLAVRRRTLLATELATPLDGPDGRTLGALVQTAGLVGSSAVVAAVLAVLGAASLFVVALGTVFGLHASRPLVRRFGVIAAAAEAWSLGRFDHRIADGRDDELGGLARRLDAMASRIAELLLQRQEHAGLQERTRLAHDLHDSVKQEAFAATMRLAAARGAQGPAAEAHLDAVDGLLRSIQTELSDLIATLRPGPEVAIETWRQVAQATETFVRPDRAPKIEATLDPAVRTPVAVAEQLARITREAVANAVRHAEAERVRVSLRSDGGDLVLRIRDDGTGFDPAAPRGSGHGLESLRDRARLIGATLRIDSAPGSGTSVEARLPLPGSTS